MPKKMTPKSQANQTPTSPPPTPTSAIPIFNYFLTLRRYHGNKYTLFKF